MCMKVDCSNCGKPTWKGCGLHIQSALRGIDLKDRCPNWTKGASKPCTDEDRAAESGSEGIRSAWAGFCN